MGKMGQRSKKCWKNTKIGPSSHEVLELKPRRNKESANLKRKRLLSLFFTGP